MIQKLKYIACVSVMLFVSGLSYALDNTQTDKDSCFLWEVRSKTATVYLMGSFHMFKRDMYPLDNCINGAFSKADTLVVEINMDAVDQDKMSAMFNERGRYPKGVTIEQRLS